MEQLLQALGTPRRREILRLVRQRERSAGEIHRALDAVTFGAVSQHLRVLERARLVTVRREGRSRLYRARPQGLAPLQRWLEAMWDDALARLQGLAEAEEAGRDRAPRAAAPAPRSRKRRRRES